MRSYSSILSIYFLTYASPRFILIIFFQPFCCTTISIKSQTLAKLLEDEITAYVSPNCTKKLSLFRKIPLLSYQVAKSGLTN